MTVTGESGPKVTHGIVAAFGQRTPRGSAQMLPSLGSHPNPLPQVEKVPRSPRSLRSELSEHLPLSDVVISVHL